MIFKYSVQQASRASANYFDDSFSDIFYTTVSDTTKIQTRLKEKFCKKHNMKNFSQPAYDAAKATGVSFNDGGTGHGDHIYTFNAISTAINNITHKEVEERIYKHVNDKTPPNAWNCVLYDNNGKDVLVYLPDRSCFGSDNSFSEFLNEMTGKDALKHTDAVDTRPKNCLPLKNATKLYSVLDENLDPTTITIYDMSVLKNLTKIIKFKKFSIKTIRVIGNALKLNLYEQRYVFSKDKDEIIVYPSLRTKDFSNGVALLYKIAGLNHNCYDNSPLPEATSYNVDDFPMDGLYGIERAYNEQNDARIDTWDGFLSKPFAIIDSLDNNNKLIKTELQYNDVINADKDYWASLKKSSTGAENKKVEDAKEFLKEKGIEKIRYIDNLRHKNTCYVISDDTKLLNICSLSLTYNSCSADDYWNLGTLYTIACPADATPPKDEIELFGCNFTPSTLHLYSRIEDSSDDGLKNLLLRIYANQQHISDWGDFTKQTLKLSNKDQEIIISTIIDACRNYKPTSTTQPDRTESRRMYNRRNSEQSSPNRTARSEHDDEGKGKGKGEGEEERKSRAIAFLNEKGIKKIRVVYTDTDIGNPFKAIPHKNRNRQKMNEMV